MTFRRTKKVKGLDPWVGSGEVWGGEQHNKASTTSFSRVSVRKGEGGQKYDQCTENVSCKTVKTNINCQLFLD